VDLKKIIVPSVIIQIKFLTINLSVTSFLKKTNVLHHVKTLDIVSKMKLSKSAKIVKDVNHAW
jgi:hypothetical protein